MSIPLNRAMQNPAMARAIRKQTERDLAGRLPAPVAGVEPNPSSLSPIPNGSSSRAISFTVHGKPLSLNHLYVTDKKRNRRFPAKEGIAWKARIAAAARAAGATVLEGPVRVELLVVYPSRRSDLDNGIKPVLDALKGVCWGDDRQVAALVAMKGLDREFPRVEVSIYEVKEDVR